MSIPSAEELDYVKLVSLKIDGSGLQFTDDEFERLASSKSVWVRCLLAGYPRLRASLVDRLSGDANCRVRSRIARRRGNTRETQARLARDADFEVRRAVAANEDTHPEVLAMMEGDDDPWVRRWLDEKSGKGDRR
jgi:hypothetical protein